MLKVWGLYYSFVLGSMRSNIFILQCLMTSAIGVLEVVDIFATYRCKSGKFALTLKQTLAHAWIWNTDRISNDKMTIGHLLGQHLHKGVRV